MKLEQIISLFLNGEGKPITECLVDLSFCSSKADAKRNISQGSVKIDSKTINSHNAKVFNIDGTLIVVDEDSEGNIVIR